MDLIAAPNAPKDHGFRAAHRQLGTSRHGVRDTATVGDYAKLAGREGAIVGAIFERHPRDRRISVFARVT